MANVLIANLPTYTGNTSDMFIPVNNSGNTTTYKVTRETLLGSQIPWSSYTPTWTASSVNPSIGNGSITGNYAIIGKTCFVRVRVAMGTTTTYGSGAWYFSLPVTAASPYGVIMPATMLDNGNNWYSGLVNGGRLGDTTKSEIQWQNTSGVSVGLTSTIPFTWGSSDELEFNGSYEIA